MKNKILITIGLLSIVLLFFGCNQIYNQKTEEEKESISGTDNEENQATLITLSNELTKLESGLSAIQYEGDTGFELFLSLGGASSDADVVSFLLNSLSGVDGMSFSGNPFGCSTVSVKDWEEHSLFGRNFDWNRCEALIVKTIPTSGYASISTVNTGFIAGVPFTALPDETQALIACYAPLDGMNEMGLCVSVNMIEDSDTISQNTEKPDITTTTAIRLLLDKAATVEEATALLSQYDMHASMNYMIHFAIADADGNSVCVEYVNQEMKVNETQVVTNFYLSEGEKYGIGTSQSKERYDILCELIESQSVFSMDDVRDALDSVSKDSFNGFESTEWSIVYNQSTGEVRYYHRENYTTAYTFQLEMR